MYSFIISILDQLVQNPIYAVGATVIGFLTLFFITKARRIYKNDEGPLALGLIIGLFGLMGLGLWIVTTLGVWPFALNQPITFLPLEEPIENGNGTLVFTIDSFEFTDSIEGSGGLFAGNKLFKPRNGVFLILNAKLTNLTSNEVCIHGQDFTLYNDNHPITMSRDILRVAISRYKRGATYPNFYWGQCLQPNEQISTFLLFDTSNSGNLLLQVSQQQLHLGEISQLLKE